MPEELHLDLPGRELLHLDPGQAPHVVEEALAHAAALQQLEEHPDGHLPPRPAGAQTVHHGLVVERHEHVGHPHAGQEEEAEDDLCLEERGAGGPEEGEQPGQLGPEAPPGGALGGRAGRVRGLLHEVTVLLHRGQAGGSQAQHEHGTGGQVPAGVQVSR